MASIFMNATGTIRRHRWEFGDVEIPIEMLKQGERFNASSYSDCTQRPYNASLYIEDGRVVFERSNGKTLQFDSVEEFLIAQI